MKTSKWNRAYSLSWRGMAINISVLLMVFLVMLVVMFLLSGVFKDFAFQQHGLFGLTPGTETVQITDSDVSKKITIDCTKKAPGDYEYLIKIIDVGFSYPSKNKVYPVFVFKGLTATSVQKEVELPGRRSFDSLAIRYNLKKINNNKDVEPSVIQQFDATQTAEGKETVILGFFKSDAKSYDEDKCFNIAKSSNLEEFINKCAKTLEVETSVVATRKACG